MTGALAKLGKEFNSGRNSMLVPDGTVRIHLE
jgi:hypothetical protein